MERTELAKLLGVEPAKVDELVAEGLPLQADIYIVAEWLEKSGRGERYGHQGMVRTLREVATAFGVSQNTVKKDWRPSGMPGQAGHWDLAAIAVWKALRERNPTHAANAPGASAEDQRRRLAADAKIKEETARKLERENKIAEGNTLHRDNAERALRELIVETASSFMRLAREIMPLLPKGQEQRLGREIEQAVRRKLNAMAAWRPDWGDDVSSD